MFIWVTLPAHIDSMALLTDAVAANVAFVPGAPFFANEPLHNTLRLSFVTVSPAQLDFGVKTLAGLLTKLL
jgi:2-aminoadipate transaminase